MIAPIDFMMVGTEGLLLAARGSASAGVPAAPTATAGATEDEQEDDS
jgi:hypothetical protein